MRKRKPRAYLTKEINGYWCLEPVYHWIARDYWGVYVTSARTRKECESSCRERGYVPERG